MRSTSPTQIVRQSPRWIQASLRLTLIVLLGQLLIAMTTNAATSTITVAVPSFDTSNANAFQINGNAALVSNYIRLTPATASQAGSAFWKNRVSLANQRSFSSYFVLSFTSPGGGPPIGADGIVFTIQTQSNTAGGSGGGIGYQDIAPSIGIEFDTWQNTDVSDPDENHVGLDVGGSVTSIATNVSQSRTLPGNLEGSAWHVWVDYNGATSNLQVRMSATNNRPGAAVVLDVTRNLSNDIGQDVYIGFTAGTGGAFENQDVQTFYFANDYVPIDTNTNTYIQAAASVTAVANPTSIITGQSSTITATVRDIAGNVMPGQTVSFTTNLGTLVTSSGVSDANGQVSVVLNGGAPRGLATVRATVAGGIYGDATVNINAFRLYVPLYVHPAP